MTKKYTKVLIESPFAGDIPTNIAYARAAARDSLKNYGEAPFLSHLLYTQEGILDDFDPEERQMGIDAGLEWGKEAEKTIVYVDRGISTGMEYGIKRAIADKRPVEFRTLQGNLAEVNRMTLQYKAMKDVYLSSLSGRRV